MRGGVGRPGWRSHRLRKPTPSPRDMWLSVTLTLYNAPHQVARSPVVQKVPSVMETATSPVAPLLRGAARGEVAVADTEVIQGDEAGQSGMMPHVEPPWPLLETPASPTQHSSQRGTHGR